MDSTRIAKQRLPALALLVALTLLVLSLGTVLAVPPDGQMLARIVLRSPADLALAEASRVPVYARLVTDSEPFLLAGTSPEELAALRSHGLEVTVLDPDMREARYYLVSLRGPRHLAPVADLGELLHSDGIQAIIRSTEDKAARLVEVGYDSAVLSPKPISLHPRTESTPTDAVQPDPFVAAMIAQVDTTTLHQYEAWLTGEQPAVIGGEPYTLVTRHTSSGTPIQKATQSTYEHLEELGLEVQHHHWAEETNPNVIATKDGLTRPDEVFILSAHLDDMPAGPVAPGADDNASGSTGVLAAADILSQYDFDCSLMFTLWTGEEQGLKGSKAWAAWAGSQDLNIRGVLNLDMIAYNSDDSPIVDLHARSWLSDSVTMAHLFANVVEAYDLDLVPEVLIDDPRSNYSDNRSFWDEGYAAILAIEDADDSTPYYHTVSDTLSTLDMAYFAEFVRASVATFAHVSDCLVREGDGTLSGRVTEASGPPAAPGGMAIGNATVSIHNPAGQAFVTVTDSSGYYGLTLPAGVFTITASAHGYLPLTMTGVAVFPSITHTLDLDLEPIPIAAVVPRSLETTLQTGDIVTQTLRLANHGRASLEFSWQEVGRPPTHLDPEKTWLSVAPATGDLFPGKQISIAVTLDSAGLEPGTYPGALELESNDPLTPRLSIPVTLTLEAPCEAAQILTINTETAGCTVRFEANVTGTEPFIYLWDFGPFGTPADPAPTVEMAAGAYQVALQVWNCGFAGSDRQVLPLIVRCGRVHLPLVLQSR